MDRRTFLKLTGLVAVAPLAEPFTQLAAAELPGASPLLIQQPGMYRLTGLVRLQSPVVEISGISNKQHIHWSDRHSVEAPTASFVSYETYDQPGAMPEVRVRGGRLESLSMALID